MHIVICSILISSIRSRSPRTTLVAAHNTNGKFEILMPKEVKNLLKSSMKTRPFTQRLLPLLLNERTVIQINTTLTIPFYQVDSIAQRFPLFRNIVKFRTRGLVKDGSAKLTKLEAAFNRLWKIVRHPRMLQEIAVRNFSLWDNKRFMPGKKLIEMLFTTTFNGDFPIIIEILPSGKLRQL